MAHGDELKGGLKVGTQSYCLGAAGQTVIDPCTDGLAKTQLAGLAVDPVQYDGVKCGAIINKEHPHI